MRNLIVLASLLTSSASILMTLGCGDDPAATDARADSAADVDIDAAEPDAAEPDAAEPDTAEPDTAEPDAAGPDVEGDTAEVTLDVVVVPPERPTPTLVWEPCNELLGEPHERVECATVTVPLSGRDPDTRTIELFVKRMRAAEPETPPRAVWVLTGGPGQSGADAESTAAMLEVRDPGADVYLPDHRGTGHSTRLTCPTQEHPLSEGGTNIEPQEWPGCRDHTVATWGTGLQYFSTTEAAYDLESLVRAVHPVEDRVVLLGISYGTVLAQRYLTLFPSGAGVDGVVLDSLCTPGTCHLSSQDLWEDDVAEQILSHCGDDPDCSRYFPPEEPRLWEQLGELYHRLELGQCALTDDPAIDVELLRTHLGYLMFNYGGRRIVPALVHRWLRCAPADIEAIRHSFVTNLGFDPLTAFGALPLSDTLPFQAQQLQGYSFPLAVNIVWSELWEPADPPPSELLKRWAGTRSCRGVSRRGAWWTPGWPRYGAPLQDVWPEMRVPILAMNADYDPATPAEHARLIAPHLTGPHQRYVELPGHGHFVIAQGQLVSDPTTSCGRELFLQFLADPTAELDTSCVADSLKLQFKVRPQAAQYWIGTTDLWGDTIDAP